MGLFDMFRRRERSKHVVGRIVDDPQVIGQNGARYMVFHLAETPGVEFRLAMLPTTMKRRKGDRVELTCAPDKDGIAIVEALSAAPDRDSARRRNQEYLSSIKGSESTGQH